MLSTPFWVCGLETGQSILTTESTLCCGAGRRGKKGKKEQRIEASSVHRVRKEQPCKMLKLSIKVRKAVQGPECTPP